MVLVPSHIAMFILYCLIIKIFVMKHESNRWYKWIYCKNCIVCHTSYEGHVATPSGAAGWQFYCKLRESDCKAWDASRPPLHQLKCFAAGRKYSSYVMSSLGWAHPPVRYWHPPAVRYWHQSTVKLYNLVVRNILHHRRARRCFV